MTWLTRVHLRTWQHHMTTIMQPCQCDLQPQIQERHRTTHTGATWNNHSLQNTAEEPIDIETIQAAPAAHRRYLSLPAAAHFTRKNARFRAPASSPKQSPCNIHAAITRQKLLHKAIFGQRSFTQRTLARGPW